jgi:hypothetical protein
MPKTETILQVFVASPGDVDEERGVLEEIIREHNITWADTLGIRLDLIRWETHAAPGFGDDAQDVINYQISDSYDIFIGIMWKRFGTPTKHADSGTEEEFKHAYDRHKQDPDSVEIMFYFKDTPVSPSDIDPDQIRAINQFKSRLENLGGLYFKFKSIEEFRNKTRMHLSRAVNKWKKRLEQHGKKAQFVTEQEVTKAETDESVEEDEGFLDLIETANDSLGMVTDVLKRMTEATNVLGEKLQGRTEDVNKLATPSGRPNIKAVKGVAVNAANDLDDFVNCMNVEIPLFSDSFGTAMDSFGRAAVLTSDFGTDNSDDLKDSLDAVSDFRTAITVSRDQVGNFREVVAKFPRMTKSFNLARRNAIATLDKFLDELDNCNRQSNDVEILLSELIEQYKTTEDG